MADRSSSRATVVGVALVVAVLAIAGLWFQAFRGALSKEVAEDAVSETRPRAAPEAPDVPSLASRDRRPPTDAKTKDAEAVEYLRDQFGATIENKRTQIKALEKLIAYLMKEYPNDWQQRLEALLGQAFPELKDQLLAQFRNMSSYNEWLAANRDQLARMSPPERRDALRDARFRYFGQDAAEIWEEAIRQEQILDAMDAIDQTPDATVDQKLETFVDSINEAYGDKAPEFVERRQTELMNGFLTLPSVQDDLHSMSAAERAQNLDKVRTALGLDDEARTRWRDLDAERDSAWENGQRYMEQRDAITSGYDGDEQARRLADLRNRMFGEEAEIIQQEEAADFFRFGHRRVYGKE
jgi:hypothetical protein